MRPKKSLAGNKAVEAIPLSPFSTTQIFFLTLFLVSSMFVFTINSVVAEIPPPVYGIEIFEYDDLLLHPAGTTKEYEVKVKNIGVLSLRDVKLGAEKISNNWFLSDSIADLEFEETGVLKYKLEIPESASGLHLFSLVVQGSYGVGMVSDIEPVVLNILVSPESNITPAITTTTMIETTITETVTTTTVVETAATTTTQPPIVSISDYLTNLTERVKSEGLEIVFSKFRAAVTYVRTSAKSILTNEALVYKTAAALFVLMLILTAIRKAVISW